MMMMMKNLFNTNHGVFFFKNLQGLRFAVDMDIQLLINCIGALVL